MRSIICLAALMALAFAGATLGDSLSVTSAAGLGGSAQNTCLGDGQPGPCGLEVIHDNSSKAFVQDDSPNGELIYRGDFLFDPNDIGPIGTKFRQNIFSAMSFTPSATNCPGTIRITALRVYILWKNGTYFLQARGRGNLCGERATLPRVVPIVNGPNRICFEIEHGNSLSGRFAIAVVDPSSSCPTSEDPAWFQREISNGNLAIDQARMGVVATNNFGAGEDGSMYFDEFESFRTLAP